MYLLRLVGRVKDGELHRLPSDRDVKILRSDRNSRIPRDKLLCGERAQEMRLPRAWPAHQERPYPQRMRHSDTHAEPLSAVHRNAKSPSLSIGTRNPRFRNRNRQCSPSAALLGFQPSSTQFPMALHWDEECDSVRHRARISEPLFSPTSRAPVKRRSLRSYGRVRVSAHGEEGENRADHDQPSESAERAQQRVGWRACVRVEAGGTLPAVAGTSGFAPANSPLADVLSQFDADESVGCVVITGSEKAFVAGVGAALVCQDFGRCGRRMTLLHNTHRRPRIQRTAQQDGAASGGCRCGH